MSPLFSENPVVQHVLASLNPHKGQCPDSLYPAVFKAIALLVAQQQADLINLSNASAEVPEDRRTGIMCSSYEKDNRDDPGNCHLVSLTSVVYKSMETVLKGANLNHIQIVPLAGEQPPTL